MSTTLAATLGKPTANSMMPLFCDRLGGHENFLPREMGQSQNGQFPRLDAYGYG
jgi:hypothetical protein